MCLDVQGGIKAKRQPFVVLSMSRGGPNKVNVIAPFCSCTCFVFDKILDSRSMECENTYAIPEHVMCDRLSTKCGAH